MAHINIFTRIFDRFQNKEKIEEYKNRITASFPKEIMSDVSMVCDILPLEATKTTNARGDTYAIALENIIDPSNQYDKIVVFNNETLTFGYQNYCFNEPNPEKEESLTELQKTILHCIYLKHHNGYIRQKRLELLAGKNEPWIIPHTFPLLGEYVVEIVEVLATIITDENISLYGHYIQENPRYYQTIKSRMINYYNRYYRWERVDQYGLKWKEKPKQEYVGYKLIHRLEEFVFRTKESVKK